MRKYGHFLLLKLNFWVFSINIARKGAVMKGAWRNGCKDCKKKFYYESYVFNTIGVDTYRIRWYWCRKFLFCGHYERPFVFEKTADEVTTTVSVKLQDVVMVEKMATTETEDQTLGKCKDPDKE